MRNTFEPLESRRLLSMDMTLVLNGGSLSAGVGGGPLVVVDNAVPPNTTDFSATGRRDVIVVSPEINGAVVVWINGVASRTGSGKLNLFANGGNDKIHIDLPDSYAHWSISVHGGGGDDAIVGGAPAERVMAGDGNDYVVTNGGRDTIYGEGGDDSLRGGGFSDLLDGGDGRDTLRGDAGNDNISGGGDTDRLRGSLGDDTLRGGASKDFIGGEDGKDWLEGDGGADVLAGGDGNDYVNGGPGDDYCEGNAGNDVLAGWSGVDQLFGGPDGDAIQSPSEWTETRDFGVGDWNPIDNGPGGDGIVINVSGTGAVTRTNLPVSGTTPVKLDEKPRPTGGVLDILLLP